MTESILVKIDDKEVNVPSGTLVVDAAKRIGNDIPVFCHHPKLDPVGMCRMCLVEVGTPLRDKETGEIMLEENGQPTISWMPNLQTACTMVVSDGMRIRTTTSQVARARKDVVEFLLTSHPLDCPVCDKGGECPLQNLTMSHGSSQSRFLLEEKMNIEKHVPLGDLIFLDRERCIQCARCTRFQDELVGDSVIGFDERGRSLQIITHSDPGFDSYFSGNTTDICPVGALTTADFRFGARPWELTHTPSICPHCSVGCNLHINTRRSGQDGNWSIKRVMPRQNEQVNEIWVCDKGRFGHHFVSSPDRLTVPLVRRHGDLVETSWDHALNLVSEKIRLANGLIAGFAGERLSNEDLFAFRTLIDGNGGRVSQWPGLLGGGDLVQQVGVGVGTDLANLGADTAILVIASDLAEEAPLWWFKVRQAATKLGAAFNKSRAALIVANARDTKLDEIASRCVRYRYGDEVRTILALTHTVTDGETGLMASIAANDNDDVVAAAEVISTAKNLIIIYGGEGLNYAASNSLAQACTNLLIAKGNLGKKDNGLIPVWSHCNTQGAWDMGVKPSGVSASEFVADASVVLLAGADPVGDGEVLPEDAFVVVSELFRTKTAMNADVVLPAQAFAEREGSYTSGDRRVQRFYQALPSSENVLPDWEIFQRISKEMGIGDVSAGPAAVMRQISMQLPQYRDISYENLASVKKQWPDIGGNDSYYGGTGFQNTGGLGVQTYTSAESGASVNSGEVEPFGVVAGELLGIPVTVLYDHGSTFVQSEIMSSRVSDPYIELNADDASLFNVTSGDMVSLAVNGTEWELLVRVSDDAPQGAVLIPRSMGGPILRGIVPVSINKANHE